MKLTLLPAIVLMAGLLFAQEFRGTLTGSASESTKPKANNH
jgi:hypothetical protein